MKPASEEGLTVQPITSVEHAEGCGIPGALSACVSLDFVIPIVHGPTSCQSGYRYVPLLAGKVPLVPTTSLEDIDIALGSWGKLTRAVETIRNRYHPRVILVLLTCTSSISSEVAPDLVRRISDPSCVVKVVDASGIECTESEGFRRAYEALRDALSNLFDSDRQTNEAEHPCCGVFLDGFAATDYSADADYAALALTVEDAFGLSCVGGFPYPFTLRLGTCYLRAPTIMCGRVALPEPDLASKNRVLPGLMAPVGPQLIEEWVTTLGEALATPLLGGFKQRLERLRRDTILLRKRLSGARVFIEGDLWRALALGRFFTRELNMDVGLSLPREAFREIGESAESEFEEVLYDLGGYSLVSRIRRFRPHLVFGSSYTNGQDWAWVAMSQPVWDDSASVGATIGLRGTENLIGFLSQRFLGGV
ncbi:MAG: nitrogenase component 1 [Bacteroidota bacterium]